MSELKDRIESIFCQKLSDEPVEQTIGLRAEFAKQADLISIMGGYRDQSTGDFVHINEEFSDLVEDHGIIVFSNAVVSGTPNAQLSGRSEDGLSLQDVFHFDPFGVISLIYKPSDVKREVPTDYTYIDEVKKALSLLGTDFPNEKVVEALKAMSHPKYKFSLEKWDKAVRNTVQFQLPEFNQRIFDLIPADRKLRHHWTSCQNEIVAHSNIENHILHGRQKWHGGANYLIGMDISR